MIKAIFFDLDGVLFDSETYDQQLNREYIQAIHAPLPSERLYLLIGSHKSQDPWTSILKGYEDKIDKEAFRDGLRAYKAEKKSHFNFAEVLFPDVPQVLDQLKKREIKMACASSSSMKYIHKALTQADILQYFDLICSGDDFVSSKPAPDIYLYCQKYFGYEKEECLVVEDSPYGIQAGKNAEIKVAARFSPFGLDQSKADYQIKSFNELIPIIDKCKS